MLETPWVLVNLSGSLLTTLNMGWAWFLLHLCFFQLLSDPGSHLGQLGLLDQTLNHAAFNVVQWNNICKGFVLYCVMLIWGHFCNMDMWIFKRINGHLFTEWNGSGVIEALCELSWKWNILHCFNRRVCMTLFLWILTADNYLLDFVWEWNG